MRKSRFEEWSQAVAKTSGNRKSEMRVCFRPAYAMLAIAGLLVAGCIPPSATGIKNFGETGKIRLYSGGLGSLPFTPETRAEWDAAAQGECDKHWPGTKAQLDQALGKYGATAWYFCR